MFPIILQAQSQSMVPQLVLMVAVIGVFYFFMIRPQQKKAKEQKKFIEEVKVGDRVVTIGGAHGRIAEIDDDTFVLEVERGGRIRFSKSAISMESTKPAASKKA